MNVQIQAHRLDMSSYACVPSVFEIPASLPADAIRLCALNNLTSWEELSSISFLKYQQNVMKALVESSFNQSFNASFIWDDETTLNCSSVFTFEKIDENPPVIGLIRDDGVIVRVHSLSAQAFFGLINAGGFSAVDYNDVNFADVFDDAVLPVSSELLLPDQVLCNESNKTSWSTSTEFSRVFSSKSPPEYDSQKISRDYLVKVKNTDLNLLSFFSGKTEVNMGISFEKTRIISVMKRSSELSIPEGINLSFLNADAFRLCVDEGVFSSDEVDQYITHHEIELENTSRRLFPSIKGSAVTELDVFEDSLIWDRNISDMDEEDPVVLLQCMESTAPLSCSFSMFPPQFSFETQNLTFVGVAEETVTYNMSFPKGIVVQVLSSSRPIVQKVSSEGNAILSVRLNASEEGKVINVLISMQPSALYILGLFVPCIISVIITFVLFIVVYIIRKKRNLIRQGRQEPIHHDQNEVYENEEYYVPPKPPSKR
jgi:large-conductance mechanosensitive channel